MTGRRCAVAEMLRVIGRGHRTKKTTLATKRASRRRSCYWPCVTIPSHRTPAALVYPLHFHISLSSEVRRRVENAARLRNGRTYLSCKIQLLYKVFSAYTLAAWRGLKRAAMGREKAMLDAARFSICRRGKSTLRRAPPPPGRAGSFRFGHANS